MNLPEQIQETIEEHQHLSFRKLSSLVKEEHLFDLKKWCLKVVSKNSSISRDKLVELFKEYKIKISNATITKWRKLLLDDKVVKSLEETPGIVELATNGERLETVSNETRPIKIKKEHYPGLEKPVTVTIKEPLIAKWSYKGKEIIHPLDKEKYYHAVLGLIKLGANRGTSREFRETLSKLTIDALIADIITRETAELEKLLEGEK